jgi:hypothetical protein
MKTQLANFTQLNAMRHSHALRVKTAHSQVHRHHAPSPFRLKYPLGTGYALLLIATCSVFMCVSATASTPLPDDLQLVPTNDLPVHASWYSVRRWGHYPPSPFNWCHGRDDVLYYRSATFGTNRIIIDDSTVDYPLQSAPPGPSYGSGDDTGPWPRYNSNDIWLEIQADTNQAGYIDLILHGITNQYKSYWQLLSNPIVTLQPWGFAQIYTNTAATNNIYYQPVPKKRPMDFFRAAGGDNIVSVAGSADATEPDQNGNGGLDGYFAISLSDNPPDDVTVWYSLSGTAVPILDYTNYTGTFDPTNRMGSIVVAAHTQGAYVWVRPLYETNVDYDEPAVFTIILTNDYVVSPTNFSATVFIRDDHGTSNLFSVVATNIHNPVGIDYSPPQHGFILPINYTANNPTFGLLSTNGTVSTWSSLAGIDSPYEVRIATVKVTTNGLTAGDLLFGNGTPGGIGWLSADATSSNTNWLTISNEPNLIQALYVDETGLWSNDVLAVSGGDDRLYSTNLNIWRIHYRTNVNLLASVPAQHLEGLLTVPTNTTYGPIAGTLLTGDELLGTTFSIDLNGAVTAYPSFGIFPDQFRLVSPSNDLYCVSFNGSASQILKISRTWLTNYVGDIMIEQSGETVQYPELFFMRWNGTNFDIHGIRLNNGQFLEKSTFAPVDLPPVQ